MHCQLNVDVTETTNSGHTYIKRYITTNSAKMEIFQLILIVHILVFSNISLSTICLGIRSLLFLMYSQSARKPIEVKYN